MLDEPREVFEKILGYANHVDLFAGEISAAHFLDRELSGEQGTWRL